MEAKTTGYLRLQNRLSISSRRRKGRDGGGTELEEEEEEEKEGYTSVSGTHIPCRLATMGKETHSESP